MARRMTRKSAKRRMKKRSNKKYSKGSAKQTGAFAARQFVKLKYTSTYDHIAATSNILIMRGNGIYDPEAATGGSQPLGFDEWAGFYQNYRVRASKIKCSYVVDPAAGAVSPAVQICVLPNVAGTTYTSQLASQQRFARSKFVPSSCVTTQVLKSYCKTSSIFGVTKRSVADQDNFGAPVTTTPSNQWYWNFTAYSLDGSTAVDAWLQAEITYYVEFFNPKILAQS